MCINWRKIWPKDWWKYIGLGVYASRDLNILPKWHVFLMLGPWHIRVIPIRQKKTRNRKMIAWFDW
jgi:hypothetical protein